jgi:hypothetical protein
LIDVIRLISISEVRQVTLDELRQAASAWAKDTAFHKAQLASDGRVVPIDGKKEEKIGVLPEMLKSNALCVYFQM